MSQPRQNWLRFQRKPFKVATTLVRFSGTRNAKNPTTTNNDASSQRYGEGSQWIAALAAIKLTLKNRIPKRFII
jgi:hypothetical protein